MATPISDLETLLPGLENIGSETMVNLAVGRDETNSSTYILWVSVQTLQQHGVSS
jgi:hypothetical protein